MAGFETRGLRRDFGQTTVVADLDLRVEAGEMFGFLGANGAGKTTTVRMLTGLLEPTAGQVWIAGQTYAEGGAELRRRVGYVPDTPPLYDYLTGRQHIGFVASLFGVPATRRDAAIEHLGAVLGLDERLDQLCAGYSLGMRKKVHLVAVLATDPAVLFLDEPTTALDPRAARALQDLLRERCDAGAAVFLTTHLLESAERICDRVGILRDGRLIAQGRLDELSGAGDASLEDVFLRLTEAIPPDVPQPGDASEQPALR